MLAGCTGGDSCHPEMHGAALTHRPTSHAPSAAARDQEPPSVHGTPRRLV